MTTNVTSLSQDPSSIRLLRQALPSISEGRANREAIHYVVEVAVALETKGCTL